MKILPLTSENDVISHLLVTLIPLDVTDAQQSFPGERNDASAMAVNNQNKKFGASGQSSGLYPAWSQFNPNVVDGRAGGSDSNNQQQYSSKQSRDGKNDELYRIGPKMDTNSMR